jgi:hypothetical protein
VQVRGALDGDAGEHRPAAGLREGALHAEPHLAEQVVHVDRRVGRDHQLGPAQDVDLALLDPIDPQAVQAKDRAALGPGLVRVATLQVAGVDHPGVAVQDHAPVHVAERPVLVAVAHQLRDGAGRVVAVLGAGDRVGVQDAEVEEVAAAGRVGLGEVVLDAAGAVALAVHGEAEAGILAGLGGLDREGEDVLGQGDVAGEHGLGVVVAADHDDLGADLAEAGELADEEQAGVEVAPLAVEDVAGEDEEGGLLLETGVDETHEGAAGGEAEVVHRCALEATEAA